MAPMIKRGDYVLIDRALQSAFRPGDVVCYLRGDEFVVHRLLFKKHGLWRAKGDHLWGLDMPIETRQIFGKVVTVIRGVQIIDLFHKQNIVNRTIMVIINTLMVVLPHLFPSLLDKGRNT